jgi:hypothetical protein
MDLRMDRSQCGLAKFFLQLFVYLADDLYVFPQLFGVLNGFCLGFFEELP